MGRPAEGLGQAFSCRLPDAMDKEIRQRRTDTGEPLSTIVRNMLHERAQLLEKADVRDARFGAKWLDARKEVARLRREIKRLEDKLAFYTYSPEVDAAVVAARVPSLADVVAAQTVEAIIDADRAAEGEPPPPPPPVTYQEIADDAVARNIETRYAADADEQPEPAA